MHIPYFNPKLNESDLLIMKLKSCLFYGIRSTKLEKTVDEILHLATLLLRISFRHYETKALYTSGNYSIIRVDSRWNQRFEIDEYSGEIA